MSSPSSGKELITTPVSCKPLPSFPLLSSPFFTDNNPPHSEKYNLPITALPLPTSTLYVVNSPALMTAVLKHKHMSLDEFIEVFSVNALGLSREERERFKQPGYMSFLLKPVYPAFSGEALRQTAGRAGRAVAGVLNRIGGDGDGVEVEDVTEWLREVVCQAVMVGLYGERNPVTVELQRGIW